MFRKIKIDEDGYVDFIHPYLQDILDYSNGFLYTRKSTKQVYVKSKKVSSLLNPLLWVLYKIGFPQPCMVQYQLFIIDASKDTQSKFPIYCAHTVDHMRKLILETVRYESRILDKRGEKTS